MDKQRGTGRTTGLILEAIGKAVQNRGKWVVFQDHAPMDRKKALEFAGTILTICHKLNLMEMRIENNSQSVSIMSTVGLEL
jgi:hypothetical protein